MKLISTKQGICQYCKEKANQDLYGVKYRGKKQFWCDTCLRGYFITKNIPDKEIDNYFED